MKHIFLAVMVVVVVSFACASFAAGKPKSIQLDLSVCEQVTPDDGDSFTCNGEDVRVLGADTPEIKHPQHGINEDQEYGQRAAEFTTKLLKNAKRVVIVRAGKDPYKRTLAHVLVDGELLGAILVKKGLAYETISRYGDNGMPEFSLEIIEASKLAPKPKFEDPHQWRKAHQKKQ